MSNSVSLKITSRNVLHDELCVINNKGTGKNEGKERQGQKEGMKPSLYL